MSEDLTRRNFLARTSIYGASLTLAMSARFPRAEAAAQKSSDPAVLSPDEWRTVDAICARIIPSDDSPGAREANCVNFIDKALANEERDSLGMMQDSLAALNQLSQREVARDFSQLSAEDQDTLLMRLEDNLVDDWLEAGATPPMFFGYLRALTIMGFLADPKYGGNHNYSGWQLAGYPGPRHHRGGYSDAQMNGEEAIAVVWQNKH